MRVAHWYPNFLGGGGVANGVLGLASAQTRAGVDTVIATTVPAGDPLYNSLQSNTESQILKWRPSWTARRGMVTLHGIRAEARSLLRELQPDIVHVHAEFNPDNFWVPRLFDCPIVLSPHGAFHPLVLRKTRRTTKRLYLAVAKPLLYDRVQAFHALSPLESDHVSSLLPSATVYCAPHGATFQLPAMTWEPAAERRMDETVRFLFAGRLDVFAKGLDILVEAYAEVVQQLGRRMTALTLVGPDWKGGRAYLEQRAAMLGISDKISFTGALARLDVARLLTKADIYIQLSRYEAFSLSSAEALAAGRPSILTNQMGIVSFPEISSLPHVQIVPPDSTEVTEVMVKFVQRIADLRQMAEDSQEVLGAFFSWQRIAELHMEAYRRIA